MHFSKKKRGPIRNKLNRARADAFSGSSANALQLTTFQGMFGNSSPPVQSSTAATRFRAICYTTKDCTKSPQQQSAQSPRTPPAFGSFGWPASYGLIAYIGRTSRSTSPQRYSVTQCICHELNKVYRQRNKLDHSITSRWQTACVTWEHYSQRYNQRYRSRLSRHGLCERSCFVTSESGKSE